jgi:dephospho-CoA kinase
MECNASLRGFQLVWKPDLASFAPLRVKRIDRNTKWLRDNPMPPSSLLSQPKAKPVLLAIVGMSGTGKSEATKYLAKRYGLTSFYMGGVVLKEVARRGLAGSPQNERKIREQLRRRGGMAAIAKLALPSLREFFKSDDRVLLDGLYSAEELTFLRRFAKEFSVILIALHSDRHLRYERLRTRSIRPLTAGEVDLRDQAELQKLNKAIPIVLADFHICNNRSTRSLHQSLRTVMSELR